MSKLEENSVAASYTACSMEFIILSRSDFESSIPSLINSNMDWRKTWYSAINLFAEGMTLKEFQRKSYEGMLSSGKRKPVS